MSHNECRNLFGSSKSLLTKSGLVRYRGLSFVPKKHEKAFEQYWEKTFDHTFGRYMAWVWFSVGAKNLVKAALVCNKLINGKPKKLGYPVYSHETDRATWIGKVLQSQPTKGSHGSEEAQ